MIAETFLEGQQKREQSNHERMNRKWKSHFLKTSTLFNTKHTKSNMDVVHSLSYRIIPARGFTNITASLFYPISHF